MKYLELIIEQISPYQCGATMIRINTSNDANHRDTCH